METIQKQKITKLTEPLIISGERNKTIDFRHTDVRNWSISFVDCKDIVICNLIARMGDKAVRKRNKEQGRDKPKNSVGLDTISFKNCTGEIRLTKCSLFASCDEIISITTMDPIW